MQVGESESLRRTIALLLLLIALVALIGAAPSITATRNGVDSGTREYDCGGSCHEKLSSAIITLTASNTTLAPGATVTVTATVTGGQAGSILGVMIVTVENPVPQSIPSAMGWEIVSDPSGATKYNYYEITDYAGSRTFTWTLNAPQTADDYQLYARVMHGGDNQAYAIDSTVLPFVVGSSGPPTGPVISLISPSAGQTVDGTISVDAVINSGLPISYAVLRVDGFVRENKTESPFQWSLNTLLLADGDHVINITAVDTAGHFGYKQLTFTVDNARANTLILNWVWTMAAGSIAIIAAVSVLMVTALLIRRRVMGGAK